ncbi:unnamed protein product [Ranitomeya imitator]|uniref:Ig-like domain-containing protein n=1 Tax=Ranitomeya imitator TaxID=111125 RepID=A0ABN9M4K7_9NEOB|nr:unnamed protein product [Ranitomeya imitator]
MVVAVFYSTPNPVTEDPRSPSRCWKKLSCQSGPDGKDWKSDDSIRKNVSGMCEPKISEILETKELVCEVESESNSSIIWRNNHRYVYKTTKATKILTQGYKLRSTLKLTEEIEKEDNQLCCAASDGIHKEKEVCFPTTSGLHCNVNSWETAADPQLRKRCGSAAKSASCAPILSPLNRNKNSTVSIVIIFVVVALVAAAVGYLIKRRNGIIMRAQRLSIASLLGQGEYHS